jgi:hypothetical protein
VERTPNLSCTKRTKSTLTGEAVSVSTAPREVPNGFRPYFVFIKNQQMHFLTVLLLHSASPTCFDTRASSSGSFPVPAEIL